MASDDPVMCFCKNVCTRSQGRGACPCVRKGDPCHSACSCGTKRMLCQNSESFEKFGIADLDSDDDTEELSEPSSVILDMPCKRKNVEPVAVVATKKLLSTNEAQIGKLSKQVGGPEAFMRMTMKFFSQPVNKVARKAFIGHLAASVNNRETEDEPQPSTSSHNEDVPTWCTCGLCRPMNFIDERKCCSEAPCFSLSDDFKLHCLNRRALQIAVDDHADMYAERMGDYSNKSMRYQAYRRLILLLYGRLGAGVRIPCYSCCVWAIRDLYPSENGEYIGFKQAIQIRRK